MKKFLLHTLGCFLLLSSYHNKAQTFTDGGSYMNYIGAEYKKVMEDYMSYTSAVAHGKSARKVESKRIALLQSVKDAKKKVASMPAYEGDKNLRDSAAAYLQLTYLILNDDYGKIVNMEEIAEQSYDAMEAYLMAQELANQKQDEAGKRLDMAEKEFAGKHNVNLVDNKSELSKQVEIAAAVNKYHRIIFLIFFKSYKQEAYMMDAINSKNVNAIEQNRVTLLKYAEEGLASLSTIDAYKGDVSLKEACRKVLEFYKKECKDKMGPITGYIIKEENFQKIKKAFDAKKQSEKKQSDVDEYNKAVNELNQSSNEYNATNVKLNDERKTNLDNWNKTVQSFLDKHTPKYK